MAIIIPSRNIYEKDNDKIRDNKIDRIEVGAFEIKPDNDYETTVYNEDIVSDNFIEGNNYDVLVYEQINDDSPADRDRDVYVYYRIKPYFYEFSISFKDVRNNKYISSIMDNIGVSIDCKKYSTTAESIGYIENKLGGKEQIRDIVLGEINYDTYDKVLLQKIPVSYTHETKLPDGEPLYITAEISHSEDLIYSATHSKTDDTYNVTIKTVVGYERVYTVGEGLIIGDGFNDTPMVGKCEQYKPEIVKITVYGNTIGIDLQDKIIYVPNQEGSKPFSVEGNELMQTSNNFVSVGQQLVRFSDYTIVHLDDRGNDINNDGKDYNDWDYGFGATVIIENPDFYGNELAIRIFDENDAITFHDVKFTPTERQNFINVDNYGYYMGKVEVYENRISSIKSSFNKTLKHYAKGKETATIRCSISDYYDEKGEKVIATNNSNKMAFDIYDEVIPYSYGADGNDKPLSRHKDGSPKTFVVLGTRIFYDGAVWQELTLQEK